MSDLDFKAPINFEYIMMNQLCTKDMVNRGYIPKAVGLRTTANSMYGFIGKETYGIKDIVEVPINIATTRKGKPVIYSVYNKNSWGFDNCVFYVSGKGKCLEKLSKFIHEDNLKRAEDLKKSVKEMFNFELPKDVEIRPLEVFVAYLYVLHEETKQTLYWMRKTVNSKIPEDGKVPGLVLMNIDGKVVNGKRDNKIYETDLWEVGEAFTDKDDNFCLLGPKDGLCTQCI